MSGVNGSLHGFNLYAYCFNNPISYTDSQGNWPQWLTTISKILYAIINSVEGKVYAGVGLGVEADVNVCGVPVSAEVQVSESEVIVYEDGEFKRGFETEVGASLSVFFVELGDTISRGHYYDNELCDCDIWDSFADKETCEANEVSHSCMDITLGIGGSLYFGVGGGGYLQINFTKMANDIIQVFEEEK